MRRHEELYTYSEPDNEPEIVSLRASIVIDTLAPAAPGSEKAAPEIPITPQGTRDVIMPETQEFRATPIYRGAGNEAGSPFSLQGPAIIEEETTTIFIPTGDIIRYDPAGFYLLEVRYEC